MVFQVKHTQEDKKKKTKKNRKIVWGAGCVPLKGKLLPQLECYYIQYINQQPACGGAAV